MVLTPAQIIVISYVAVILVGATLLALPISHADGVTVDFIDALFTATSATSVTGLTTVPTGEGFSVFGQIVILILIQIGGLGLMVLITAMATVFGWRIGLRERRLVGMDLNQVSMGGVIRLARSVVKVALLCEGIGTLLLFSTFRHTMPVDVALYYSVFHAVSAFCNAGFDLFGSSLTQFVDNVTVNVTVVSLIVIGGLGFTVLVDIVASKSWSRLAFHSQVVLVVNALLIMLGFGVILALESSNPATLGSLGPFERPLAALFQSVTTRTAGFNTIPIAPMSLATHFLFLLLMFVGASPGSTGGGVKTSTVALLFSVLISSLREKHHVELGPYRMNNKSINAALVVVLGSISWIVLVTFVLLITEGGDFMQTLFEVVSAMGTVGLSMGLTAKLSTLGKLAICLTMFLGRVGPITVVLALSAHSSKESGVKRPERKLLVG